MNFGGYHTSYFQRYVLFVGETLLGFHWTRPRYGHFDGYTVILAIVNRRRGTGLETVVFIQLKLGQKKNTGHVTKVGARFAMQMAASTSTSFNPIGGDLLDFVVELLGDDTNISDEVAEENDIAIEEVRQGFVICISFCGKFKSVCFVLANE